MNASKTFIFIFIFFTIQNIITSFENDKDRYEMKLQEINYKESIETINNPGMGYTKTEWIYSKPNSTKIISPIGNLVLLFWDIGGFSCGKNGIKLENGSYIEGTDYDFDEVFFNGLNKTLENIRKNGGTIALRFRYDSDEKQNPEPATFDKVLDHIHQIKQSGILELYKDILVFVESGFVGMWGEQHSGKYTSLDYKVKLLDEVLDMVPDDIPVTVRTPDIAAKYFGVPLNEIDKFIAKKGSRFSRVGIYNDGYMGSDYDLGTYKNRTIETNWMNNQMRYTYYGGEFSSNIDYAKQFPTYLPENSIKEMYKTHLTYINCNIWNLYKDIIFTKEHSIKEVDNSAYYGQSTFKFIRDHLGYRFVLRESYITKEIEQGGKVDIRFTIENTGFANPIKEQKPQIILEKNGNYMKADIDIDSREWYSALKSYVNITIKIPGGIELGIWNIYIKLSVGKIGLENYYMRSVQFANEKIFNPSLGANYIGNFNVVVSSDKNSKVDDLFYQINTDKNITISTGELFTINNIHITDGKNTGNFEWNKDNLIEQVNNSKLYVSNDDNNLYIMADLPNTAITPVINMKMSVKIPSSWYWLYYLSSGSVFFNSGSYDNLTFRYNGNICEFTVPFDDTMKIHSGSIIEYIEVFIQDYAKDWVRITSIKSKEYRIKDDFFIYTAFRNVFLRKNEYFSLKVESPLIGAKYQWYKDEILINGENKKELIINKASINDIGIYSVKIRTRTGTEKVFDICNILEVY